MKRLLTILLSVFVMITTFTASVFAEGNDAKIGSTEYATLQDAIDNVDNGETIVINKPEICYDTPITIDNGKTFTIDFMDDGITQHTFRWYDMMGSQTDKDVIKISNGSNVTINNMKYLVGFGERKNRVFKVENTGTLTLNNFNSLASDNVCDTIVYNNGGTVNINNGHIESIIEKLFVQNGGTFNIGGSTLVCKINNSSYCIIYIGDGNTDENYDAGTVNVNDGEFQVAELLEVNAKVNININKANSNQNEGFGYILVTEYGKKSNIRINDYTVDTAGGPFIIIRNITMDTKITINGGKYLYGEELFCKDEGSEVLLQEVSLKGGLYGSDNGATTNAYNELSNLLAPGSTLEEIPDTDPEYGNGYYYRVYTPTPEPDPEPRYTIPNTGVEGTPNNHSLLKLSSLSLLAIGTYLVIKEKKDN